MSSGDISRETQISQFYRYAKKTQLSLDPKKCRYVGDNTGLRTTKTMYQKDQNTIIEKVGAQVPLLYAALQFLGHCRPGLYKD